MLNLSEEEYRSRGMHYSTLSTFERKGFDCIPTLFEHTSTPSTIFGSAVDAIITGGYKTFYDNFAVINMPKLSDSLASIALWLYERFGKAGLSFESISDDDISDAGIANDYYVKENYRQVRIKKIKEECKKYYDILMSSNGKTVISKETFIEVEKCVNTLKTSPATKDLFSDEPKDSPIEKLYQVQLASTFDGIEYVIAIDLLIIDHANKTIYPFDLKTTSGKEYNFEEHFVHWGYSIQARLYARVILDNISRDPDLKDYNVADYKFVVINKESLTPLVWKFPFTFSYGSLTLVDDDKVVIRDPFDIAKELKEYLDNHSVVPNGIKLVGSNIISNIKLA